MLFVRTTRRVELTPAGLVLLDRTRRGLAEIEGAITDARRAGRPDGVISIGYGPFSRSVVASIVDELGRRDGWLGVRLAEEVTPDALRLVGGRELAAAVVMETPAAARRYGVRIDALRDEPLLAALPASHEFAAAEAIPVGVFAAERVLLPREPPGRVFNAWFRTVVRAAGFELERTVETLSAPWDRRMLPFANGEAASVFVADWMDAAIEGVVGVRFDPPLSLPLDLAFCWPPFDRAEGCSQLLSRSETSRAG